MNRKLQTSLSNYPLPRPQSMMPIDLKTSLSTGQLSEQHGDFSQDFKNDKYKATRYCFRNSCNGEKSSLYKNSKPEFSHNVEVYNGDNVCVVDSRQPDGTRKGSFNDFQENPQLYPQQGSGTSATYENLPFHSKEIVQSVTHFNYTHDSLSGSLTNIGIARNSQKIDSKSSSKNREKADKPIKAAVKRMHKSISDLGLSRHCKPKLFNLDIDEDGCITEVEPEKFENGIKGVVRKMHKSVSDFSLLKKTKRFEMEEDCFQVTNNNDVNVRVCSRKTKRHILDREDGCKNMKRCKVDFNEDFNEKELQQNTSSKAKEKDSPSKRKKSIHKKFKEVKHYLSRQNKKKL